MKHFFFLPDDHMPKVFSAIARLIYYSNGGFSFQELYSGMPVYVRRYMIGEIEDIKKKEKEAIEGDSSSGAGETASREDIGQAMEQLQKQSGEKQADEEIIKEVFGSEEERKKEQKQQRPQNTERRSLQNQQKRRRQQKSENQKQKNSDKREESPPKKDSEEDPAKAKDLEQFMDKLQDEM